VHREVYGTCLDSYDPEVAEDVLYRRAARVVLIAPDDRILMLGVRGPDDGIEMWVCPGGGLESGEDLLAAARRELLEEVGIVPDAELVGPVWRRRHRFTWEGREIDQREWYFTLAVANPPPAESVHPVGPEAKWFLGARWFGVEEIPAWPPIVVPRRLAVLLPPLLAGEIPTEPIDSGV
jgi:8-oxo-dGTP pyrophosphatase MutT (NUDIX family)